MTGRTPYTDLLYQTSNVYGLPFDLLEAQVLHESSGDPWAFNVDHAFFERYIRNNARARSGSYGPLGGCSYGLLQIELETALEIGFTGRPEDLFQPKVGLAFGAKQMQRLVALVGGLNHYADALACFNGGASLANAEEWPVAVQDYVSAVYRLSGRPSPSAAGQEP